MDAKKINFLRLAVLSTILFLSLGGIFHGKEFSVKAQTQPVPAGGGGGVEIPNPLIVGTFQALVERIARYLFQIGIPIAVIMIIYAAFLYLTASGNPEKISKAHKTLIYALVGLAILFLAWGLTSLVKELLGG